MPLRRSNLFPTAAIILAILAPATPAASFSQIDPGEGRSGSREGIIAVPLPPLPPPPGARPAAAPLPDPSPSTPEHEGTDAGEVPLPPEDEAPADSRPLPSDDERPGRRPTEGGPPAPDAAPAEEPAGASRAEPLEAEIAYGEESLPRPVRDLRARLMEIARSGEIERLRPYIEKGEDGTVLSFGPAVEDPIAFLRSNSGDGEGIETLAIMLEILEAGHAHTEPGTPNEIYVWPYFTQVDLGALTRPQRVELFELVTAGDYESMQDFGGYNFYRIGISPEGRLAFFVAGD
ncbi:MAG TPA: hypothetical protein VGO17_18230 [Aurantimonas sp.]|nr:hypothetical protein [Aurantimonas sp.]